MARDVRAGGAQAGRPTARWCWASRALVALGALTIVAGTAATAAGPHAGGSPGQQINRLDFDGRGTMDFVIHRHAEIAFVFGLLVRVDRGGWRAGATPTRCCAAR